MKISIKTLKGKSINLEVEDSSEPINIKIHGEATRDVVLGLEPGQGQGQGALLRIFVSTLGGKTFILEVEASKTIENIMAQIHEKGGPPVKEQKLIFQGKELDKSRTLADYNMKTDSNICMMSRLCGC
ncbi:hypothetical protein Bca52824_033273 [Brassica carinata]|uniref:Ubiquitin-like domain-containing protein n=1 Tax=Brassica carinata TaxID=52824 RepID=A0A8X7V751_BRACI|nr:hypothetical protein Bca52824_033273 [Brassica carinata]